MNILIDASQFPVEKTGVGVYATNLIHAIVESDKRNRYFIVIQDDESAFEGVAESNVEIIKYPARLFRRIFFRFFLEQFVLPFLLLRLKIDVIHSLHYSFPLIAFGSRRVVTIHDMTFFKFPQVHEHFKVVYFRFFILLAARVADHIITDSESTRGDLIALTDAPPARVTTILLGRPESPPEGKAVADAPVHRRSAISDDYILFVGTVEPRKNLFRLILAFARLVLDKAPYQLVILGQKGWGCGRVYRLIDDLDIADHIVFTGYVDEDEKRQLMKNATVFVYPSLYEGFGLPLLEALALGLPSVTSNVSSLPEVAGAGAIQVDPYDIDAIYRAIKQALTDEKLREELSVAAREQARRFSWRTAAEKTTAVYGAAGAGDPA